MPTAAIYARKSVETDKGESIENQINRGIALCQLNGWDYIIYQDYGISGKTLDRPDFERMMKDAHAGKFQYLVCYKIDRVSRSVSDFSSLIDELISLDIGFICIKDNFDTTTPMGRAMMMITAVFAQLERETIAERVKDNMIDRAKLGKWNGGPIPLGYNIHTETIEYQGRKKKTSKLVIDEDEAAIVRQIFDMYIELGSIRGTAIKLNQVGIKTKSGSNWSDSQVSRILQNAIYCISDQDAYEYYKNHTKVQIANHETEFDGNHGLMFYNRRKEHKNTTKERDESEWILSIGEHQGIIPGAIHKKVQLLLKSNKVKAPRTGTSAKSPLTNVKCDICGQAMSIYSSRSNPDKPYVGFFRCNKKERMGLKCANKSVKADLLERVIVSAISKLYEDEKSVIEAINAYNNDNDDKRIPKIAEKQNLTRQVDEIEREIKNLVTALGKNTLPEILIQERYSELQKQKNTLLDRISTIEDELNEISINEHNIDQTLKYVKVFKESYYTLDLEERRKLLSSIIKEVRVNRDKVKLELYFLPAVDLDSPAFCYQMGVHALAKCKTISIEASLFDESSIEKLPKNTFEEKLIYIMKKLNLNKKEMAKKCGFSVALFSLWRKGSKPELRTIKKISNATGYPMSFFIDPNILPENTLGEIIYKYRTLSGMSKADLASKVGLEESTIKDYEKDKFRGKNQVTVKKIFKEIGYIK